MMRFFRDHPYGLVAAFYGFVVFAAAGLLQFFPPAQRDYVATRKLNPNHRIVAGDFRRPDVFLASLGFYLPSASSLEGRYVRETAIEPNGSIDLAKLDERPDLVMPQACQALILPLPAETGLVATINADSSVIVIGADDEKGAVSLPAKVHAILCDARKGDTQACRAVLRIPSNLTLKLPKDSGGLRFLMQVAPATSEKKC
jgi:hypothetical protein